MVRAARAAACRVAFVLAAALAAGCSGLADLNTVPVESGPAEFATGDSITVTALHGSDPIIVPGGSYRVRGRWTLASRDAADLAVWVKDGQCAGNTSIAIARGSGDFDLTFMVMSKGFPVISLRAPGTGDAFGFAYFREAGGPLPEGVRGR